MDYDICKDFVKAVYKGKYNWIFWINCILKNLIFICVITSIIFFFAHIYLIPYNNINYFGEVLAICLLILIILLAVYFTFKIEFMNYEHGFISSINKAFRDEDLRTPNKKKSMISALEISINNSKVRIINLTNAIFTILLTASISLLFNWFDKISDVNNKLSPEFLQSMFSVGIILLSFSIVLSLFFSFFSVWTVERKKYIVKYYYKSKF